eukprot:PhF_6_TR5216/c0_g1_i1/m.7524
MSIPGHHIARACKMLGVTTETPLSQVKLKYRALAATMHPDAGGDEQTFKELTSSYEMLKQYHNIDTNTTGATGAGRPHDPAYEQQRKNRPQPSPTSNLMSFRQFLWQSDFWEYTFPLGAFFVTAGVLAYTYQLGEKQGAYYIRRMMGYGGDMTSAEKLAREDVKSEVIHNYRTDKKRRTQTTFRDLREYFTVHEARPSKIPPRGLLRSEIVTTSSSNVCEVEVYYQQLKKLEGYVWKDQERYPDVGVAMGVMTKALQHVPSCYPERFIQTEVDYLRPGDDQFPRKCLLRIYGSRQEDVTKVQRILVT